MTRRTDKTGMSVQGEKMPCTDRRCVVWERWSDNEEHWTRTNSGGFDTPSASRLFKCYCDGLSPYTQGFDAHPFRQCTSSVGQLTLPGLENIFEYVL